MSSIVKATINNAEITAAIISASNKDVAKQFNLNQDNNPKHPSFCTKDWVLSDFERGVEYFLFEEEGAYIGCVAYESPRPDTAYLNRLSVLPQSRERGIGEQLTKHIIAHSRSNKIKYISIGIIAAHSKLKDWYLKLGFIETETKDLPHLPFDVTYMRFEL